MEKTSKLANVWRVSDVIGALLFYLLVASRIFCNCDTGSCTCSSALDAATTRTSVVKRTEVLCDYQRVALHPTPLSAIEESKHKCPLSDWLLLVNSYRLVENDNFFLPDSNCSLWRSSTIRLYHKVQSVEQMLQQGKGCDKEGRRKARGNRAIDGMCAQLRVAMMASGRREPIL